MTSANAQAFAFVCLNSNTEDDGPKSVKRPQGIVAGVGFLGTGLIVRNNKGRLVYGLTTAACVWVAASSRCGLRMRRVPDRCLGCCTRSRRSGFGGPFEKSIHWRWPRQESSDLA